MFDMAAAVAAVESACEVLARGLAPEELSGGEAMGLVKRLARCERQLAGVKVLLAGRMAETPVWQHQGHRSAAHWLAGTSGTSVAEAISVLHCAEQLKALPATLEVLRAGRLSRAQAVAVADAAAVAPQAEASLLAVAGRESLKGLQAEAARTKTAHLDEQARYDRVHASRHVRFGTEADGAATMAVRTTPDALAEIKAAIAMHQQRIFDLARREGRRESFEAYSADGLLAMARASLTGGTTTRVPTIVVIRVDHAAITRGHTLAGECCEITGVAPLPVPKVRAALAAGELFTALVGTNPTGQVTTVAHLGRRPVPSIAALPAMLADRGVDVTQPLPIRRANTYQRTALDWTSPLCSVAGCDQPRQQIDHRAEYARTHHTKLDELDGYCAYHHTEKTCDGPHIPPGHGRRPYQLQPP